MTRVNFPDLGPRLRSAAVLIFVALVPLIIGWAFPGWRWTVSAVAFLATVICAGEYAALASLSEAPTLSGPDRSQGVPSTPRKNGIITAIYASILCIAPAAGLIAGTLSWEGRMGPMYLLGFLSLAFLAFLIATTVAVILFRHNLETFQAQLLRLLVGVLLVSSSCVALMLIPLFPGGPGAVFWLLLVVCLSDTAAYFIGNALKGPKLAPAFSPGKTVSGAIGGLCVGGVVGAATFQLVGSVAPFSFVSLLVSVAISATGQVGDLLESGIKRICKVKDSGAWIPGHGGLLDRVDAVFFSAPVLLTVLGVLQALKLR